MQLKSCIALEWIDSLRSGMECLIHDQNTFTLYWNLVLEFYIISASAKDLKYKILYHRWRKNFLDKITKSEGGWEFWAVATPLQCNIFIWETTESY